MCETEKNNNTTTLACREIRKDFNVFVKLFIFEGGCVFNIYVGGAFGGWAKILHTKRG